MSGVNVNTSTMEGVSSEPIVASAGEAIDFDQLEAVTTSHKTQSKVDKELGVKGEKYETKQKEAKEPKEEKAEKIKETKGDKTEKPRTLKAKFEDTEVDLMPESQIEVTVDGKKETVAIKDLMQNYSGKTAWDKKFNEINKVKQEYESSVKNITQAVNQMSKKAMSGDAIGAIADLADLMGADPARVVTDLRKQFLGDIEKYKDLTPEQIEREQLALENKLYKEKEERVKTETQRKAEYQAVNQKLDTVQQQYGLNDESFYNTYVEMVNLDPTMKDQITPEAVGRYYEITNKQNQLAETLQESGLEGANLQKAFTDLADVWKANPGFKLDDIKDIASQVYGVKGSRALTRKLEKSKPTNTAKGPESRRKDPVTFDDLDE